MKRKRVIVPALVTALLGQVNQASAISLIQAYELALQNDPIYRFAFYENEAGKQNRILARSDLAYIQQCHSLPVFANDHRCVNE